MPSNEGLDHMIDEFVDPLPDRREDCRHFLQQVIEFIRVRAEHGAAKNSAPNLPPWLLRKSLNRLSITLSKAAKLVRDLGPYENVLRLPPQEKLEIEYESSPSGLAVHLDICAQTVDDWIESVEDLCVGWRCSTRAALAATYAYEIMKRFSAKPISSTEGGAFRSLADAMYEVAFGEDANANLERYVKREVKFHKKQPKNSEK